MKRYVKEFANDEMKCCTAERKAKIQHIVKVYEKGLVTSLEAVKMICDTYYAEDDLKVMDEYIDIEEEKWGYVERNYLHCYAE